MITGPNFVHWIGHLSEFETSFPHGPSERLELETVTLTLCNACLDGKGGECHTPGCALWMNRAPDVSIRDRAEGCSVRVVLERLLAACEDTEDGGNGVTRGKIVALLQETQT